MSIQVGRHGVRAEPGRLALLASEYQSRHAVTIPQFVDPSLLSLVGRRLPAAPFKPRLDARGVELEQTLDDERLEGLFTIAMNDPTLFSLIQSVTGSGAIGCFTGRIYRRGPRGDAGHYVPWHDDVSHDRLVGVSINLSDAPYAGGVLQIRDAASKWMIAEVANSGYGDAVLFRISPDLEHQVTPVLGAEPRTVLAGWFRQHPSFRALLHKSAR